MCFTFLNTTVRQAEKSFPVGMEKCCPLLLVRSFSREQAGKSGYLHFRKLGMAFSALQDLKYLRRHFLKGREKHRTAVLDERGQS